MRPVGTRGSDSLNQGQKYSQFNGDRNHLVHTLVADGTETEVPDSVVGGAVMVELGGMLLPELSGASVLEGDCVSLSLESDTAVDGGSDDVSLGSGTAVDDG